MNTFNDIYINILQKHLDNICWEVLSSNSCAIKLLLEYPHKINWSFFSKNNEPEAIELLYNNIDKIDWFYLSLNTNAIDLIEQELIQNPINHKLNWDNLSANPAAIHILENNINKINWNNLSRNTEAIHILEQNPHKINWAELSGNPSAKNLITQNIHKIHWNKLSENPALFAMDLIENHLIKNPESEDICWLSLSYNPSAVYLLTQNINKICWDYFAFNISYDAINLLEQYPDNIRWFGLSCNPSGLLLLEQNINNIYWHQFMFNKYTYIHEWYYKNIISNNSFEIPILK